MGNWKEQLRALKLAYLEKKSPDFLRLSGGANYKMKPWEDHTTAGLTRCIHDWLTYSGHWCNRINSTGVARKINGKLIYTNGQTNRGTADISAIISGKVLMIEIKNARTKDRLSKYQASEKERIERSGGTYLTVGSMNDFVSFYNHFTATVEINKINGGTQE